MVFEYHGSETSNVLASLGICSIIYRKGPLRKFMKVMRTVSTEMFLTNSKKHKTKFLRILRKLEKITNRKSKKTSLILLYSDFILQHFVLSIIIFEPTFNFNSSSLWLLNHH